MTRKRAGWRERGTVPTLTPELDPLPERCPQCARPQLFARPQLGGELFGTLSCASCGAVVAYLRPAARPRSGSRTRW